MGIKDKAHSYCIDNNIRVSPIAYEPGMKNKLYHVGVSYPEDYKKIYKSPEVFQEYEIWEEVSKAEIYYYEKSI